MTCTGEGGRQAGGRCKIDGGRRGGSCGQRQRLGRSRVFSLTAAPKPQQKPVARVSSRPPPARTCVAVLPMPPGHHLVDSRLQGEGQREGLLPALPCARRGQVQPGSATHYVPPQPAGGGAPGSGNKHAQHRARGGSSCSRSARRRRWQRRRRAHLGECTTNSLLASSYTATVCRPRTKVPWPSSVWA